MDKFLEKNKNNKNMRVENDSRWKRLTDMHCKHLSVFCGTKAYNYMKKNERGRWRQHIHLQSP